MTCRAFRPSRSTVVRPVASGGGKTDLSKVGLNSIPEGVVKNNLMGKAPQMEKKGWVDAQGRKGKVGTAWQQIAARGACRGGGHVSRLDVGSHSGCWCVRSRHLHAEGGAVHMRVTAAA